MKRFLRYLLGILGFVAASCEPSVEMYACPSVDYDKDVKSEQADAQMNAVEVGDEESEDEGR